MLNVGIFAAGFGIFVSLSDFIISPKLKKRIEQFIDEITLRLDYTKTIDWLQKWLRTSRRISIAKGFVRVSNLVWVVGMIAYLEI